MAVIDFTSERNRKEDGKAEYRAYAALAYPLFLIAAVINRLTPGSVRRKERGVRSRSIFKEAADMMNGALPWVFSGR